MSKRTPGALPLCVLAGIWLWRRRPWGHVLSGALLTILVIDAASTATDQVFGHLQDPAASLGAVPVFVVLRNLRSGQEGRLSLMGRVWTPSVLEAVRRRGWHSAEGIIY